MADRLHQLREVAVQATHDGERVAALRAAAREQGSTFGFETMICRMEQRARLFDQLAKDYPQVPGLADMATVERDLIGRSFQACARG